MFTHAPRFITDQYCDYGTNQMGTHLIAQRFVELWRIPEVIPGGVRRIYDLNGSSPHEVCTRNRKAAAARLTAVLMTWWSKLQQTPVETSQSQFSYAFFLLHMIVLLEHRSCVGLRHWKVQSQITSLG